MGPSSSNAQYGPSLVTAPPPPPAQASPLAGALSALGNLGGIVANIHGAATGQGAQGAGLVNAAGSILEQDRLQGLRKHDADQAAAKAAATESRAQALLPSVQASRDSAELLPLLHSGEVDRVESLLRSDRAEQRAERQFAMSERRGRIYDAKTDAAVAAADAKAAASDIPKEQASYRAFAKGLFSLPVSEIQDDDKFSLAVEEGRKKAGIPELSEEEREALRERLLEQHPTKPTWFGLFNEPTDLQPGTEENALAQFMDRRFGKGTTDALNAKEKAAKEAAQLASEARARVTAMTRGRAPAKAPARQAAAEAPAAAPKSLSAEERKRLEDLRKKYSAQ